MVFFDAIQAMLNLDLQFFVDVVIGNILWAFFLYVIVYILLDGKKTEPFFVIISVYLWAFLDFGAITGIGLIGAMGFFLWFLLHMAIDIWARKPGFVQKHKTWIFKLKWMVLLLYMTFLWGGR